MRRGQSASEYLIMVAGVIFIAVFLFLTIKGELFRGASNSTGRSSGNYVDEYGKPYAFYDNFDTSLSYKWQGKFDESWRSIDRTFQRYDTSFNDFFPITVGDETWINYEVSADVKVESPVTPSGNGFLVARSNENFFFSCGLGTEALNEERVYLLLCKPTLDLGGNYVCDNLNSTPVLPPYAGYLNKWVPLSMAVVDDKISCQIKGQPSITATNSSSPYGKPGIWAASTKASFDNFKVSLLPYTPTAFAFQPNPPVISSLVVNPSDTSAVFTWDTDVGADAQVAIGTASPPAQWRPLNSTLAKNHYHLETGLLPSTTYYYQVRSCSGGVCQESPASPPQSFATLSFIIGDSIQAYVCGDGEDSCSVPPSPSHEMCFYWETRSNADSRVFVSSNPGCSYASPPPGTGGYASSCRNGYRVLPALVTGHSVIASYYAGKFSLACSWQPNTYYYHIVSCAVIGGSTACSDSGQLTFTIP